jgi:hypothetical protein
MNLPPSEGCLGIAFDRLLAPLLFSETGGRMPTQGSALVGFMERDRAIRFLRENCCPADESEAALEAVWDGARRIIGEPTPNAGLPQVLDIPAEGAAYVAALRSGIYANLFADPNWGVKLVEIAPLLAFQFSVDVTRSTHHCGHLGNAPTLAELLPVALPLAAPHEAISIAQQPQSIVLKSRSLNVQAQIQGMIGPNLLGMQFGVSLPFAHVVRHNGRCYLHNGFHRTYGALLKGATHMPVIFRDVVDAASAGIRDDGNTFDINLLESAHPPTVANFHDGGSARVQLRAMTRILHVSWAEYAIPDE